MQTFESTERNGRGLCMYGMEGGGEREDELDQADGLDWNYGQALGRR